VTSIELAILGLVYERPCHGYEIEKTVRARRLRRWTDIGLSSIYAALQSLRRRRWISSQGRVNGKGPQGKAYRISPRGLAELRAEIHRRFAVRDGNLDLALMFLDSLPASRRLRALDACRRRLTDELKALPESDPRYWAARQIHRRHKGLLRAELDWVRRAKLDRSWSGS
jgi:DNA-binding PadR family transcriptional regulator